MTNVLIKIALVITIALIISLNNINICNLFTKPHRPSQLAIYPSHRKLRYYRAI